MADGRVVVAWDDPSYDAITSVIFDPRLVGVNVNGTTKNDIYVGSEYKDELFGNNGNDQLQGGLDDDKLHGGSGDDTILAGGGNDTLAGGAGKDVHNGGAGLDFATYEHSTAGVGVTASLDLAFKHITSGEAKDDTFSEVENLGGSAWDDRLLGNGGNNALFGANGADALYGGAGGDHLDGGGDRDAATYEYSTAGVGVRASLENSGVNLGEANGDTYASIEVLVGTSWNDVLIGRSTV
jgi:Ca2+-binding RTX toxin-like protein